jgi:hypothetical protein
MPFRARRAGKHPGKGRDGSAVHGWSVRRRRGRLRAGRRWWCRGGKPGQAGIHPHRVSRNNDEGKGVRGTDAAQHGATGKMLGADAAFFGERVTNFLGQARERLLGRRRLTAPHLSDSLGRRHCHCMRKWHECLRKPCKHDQRETQSGGSGFHREPRLYGGRMARPQENFGARRSRSDDRPSRTSGPAKPMNSSASEVSNAGPACRSQLLSEYLVQRIAVWLPEASRSATS